MNPQYLFYAVMGKHAGETVEQILDRKLEEIKTAGESFWSCSIDRKSIEQVRELNKDDEVLVLCKVKNTAKDPAEGRAVRNAKYMEFGEGFVKVPEGINATFSAEKNSYQAYVVEEYEILEKSLIFDFGNYASTLANGEVVSFKNRFKNCQFQNTFGFKKDGQNESCEKEISIVMHLKYPFVVNIK